MFSKGSSLRGPRVLAFVGFAGGVAAALTRLVHIVFGGSRGGVFIPGLVAPSASLLVALLLFCLYGAVANLLYHGHGRWVGAITAAAVLFGAAHDGRDWVVPLVLLVVTLFPFG